MLNRKRAEKQFIEEVLKERERQDEKWGIQTHLGHAWLGILTEEVGEVAKAINEDNYKEILIELVQVAAVAMNAYAQHVATLSLHSQFGIFTKE